MPKTRSELPRWPEARKDEDKSVWIESSKSSKESGRHIPYADVKDSVHA